MIAFKELAEGIDRLRLDVECSNAGGAITRVGEQCGQAADGREGVEIIDAMLVAVLPVGMVLQARQNH